MVNNILFVFEGKNPEEQITNSLTKHFGISGNAVIRCAYCNDIYELHKEILEDGDLDIFVLLKDLPYNKDILSNYSRNDFAEIYMFFDYDGHDTIADDKKIIETLNLFDEETSSGKLFISYPMSEALKHFDDTIDFKILKVKAKENIGYKQIVDSEAKNELKQINKYTKEIWIKLLELHLKKMNHIVNDDYSLPMSTILQLDILMSQIEKYIKVDSTVAVLSSFPIFIFDYYGYKYVVELFSEINNK